MSSTILLPPRAQLCIRYCSNKQQQGGKRSPLPTCTAELIPELRWQQCLAIALDKVLQMCEGFPAGSDEVFILGNLASILPQLLFVYGTRTEQVRKAADLFDQGRLEDLLKHALNAKEKAKRTPE